MPFITDKLESFKQEASKNDKQQVEQPQQNKKQDKQSDRFLSRFEFEVPEVMSFIRSNLIGQDNALLMLEKMLKVIKAELSSPNRPLAVALLLGPTGVGKTQTAKLLAKALSKDGSNLCRIDMNTLAQEHYAASLIGAPPGYVGSKEGNTLFDANVIAGSYSVPSVVLFDELEKASKEVLVSLLDVLDSGELTLSSGVKKIDFRNSIILMTSNLGAKEVFAYQQKMGKNNPKKEHKIIKKIVEKNFLPEFVNRIDNLIYYSSINKINLNAIIDLELALIEKNTKHKINLSNEARNKLQKAYNFTYGVRDIKRLIAQNILPLVAERVLDSKLSSNVVLQNDDFVIG
ncbi:MAG: AAA family ATPase [Helicobacter sp.]|uniref:AAA family ATPase n=1 Tax=Helicobacter sp. 10-6591 TaxID=2004998 RepID=UPI0015EB96AB|nr:AAA family ATPase [Helicobacter sp. 10-6591]MCI6217970.1 AAA family ATPase [Helicobacter sp.]MCI7485712.1 AAA family ATPase [Helicobacter sp.]MDD7567304.1 AAA family ATPase [Helicobacter sp.]MDY5740076.1 AAA family ATPase [Helicobacter sp.]